MKLRKFVALSFAILIISTVLLSIFPYLHMRNARYDYKKVSTSGSFVEYEFNDGGIFSYENNTPSRLQQVGIIKLSLKENTVFVGIAITSPLYNGTPNGFKYTQLYYKNETYNLSSAFIQTFINRETLTQGNIVSIDGEEGIVNKALSNPFSVDIANGGKVTNISTAGVGYTNPKVVNLTSVKEKTNPRFSPYENFLQYDNSGSYNVLVKASMLTGTIGISPFLQQLLSNSSINKPVLNVTGFTISLISTNIDLYPVDISHYLLEYLPFISALWIIGSAFTALTVQTARNRNRKRTPGRKQINKQRGKK